MAKSAFEESWPWPYPRSDSVMSAESAILDFFEHTMEIFMWDETPTLETAALQANSSRHLFFSRPLPPMSEGRDYAAMHDRFLESLLQEQTRKPSLENSASSLDSGPPPLMECASDLTDSASTITSQESQSVRQPPAKKRRGLRLHRKHHIQSQSRHKRPVSLHVHHADVDDDDSSCAPKRISLDDLKGNHPPPESFVDVYCRMQKDKGKGDLPGASVCAEGRDACLEKLRQKMELLAQVALARPTVTTVSSPSSSSATKKKAGADMKRRKAQVFEVSCDYTETRSVIQFRMGFLAMQYGVLLRWDRNIHKVKFVVLRKMCSESFYSKTFPRLSSTASRASSPPSSATSAPSPTASVLNNVVNGNHAILLRSDECEVALLDPPYLVARPDDFEPSLLKVNVITIDGLNPKSTWIVKMSLEGETQTLRLGWNQEDAFFEPRRSRSSKTLEWEIPQSSIDMVLQITISEQRLPQQRRRRYRISLPISLLQMEQARSRFVVLPVDDASSMTLSVQCTSEYTQWLIKEVNARKRDHVQGFSFTEALFGRKSSSSPDYSIPYDEAHKENESSALSPLNPFNILCFSW